MITWSEIIALRMERQHLMTPVDKEGYQQLFLNMSPVPTKYWTAPGDPPTLPMHVDFDDYVYNSRLRAERKLLKGRFGGGSIGYVTQEDLEVYACLYKKEVTSYSDIQLELLELLKQEGPMNIGYMKELTKLLVKEITPQLHKLQEAFIIYEDQLDNEGDRGWYLFESEFPEVDLSRYTKTEALKVVLPRAAELLVFFDEVLLKSYYRLPLKLIKEAMTGLLKEGVILPVTIEGKYGYMLKQDYDLLPTLQLTVPKSIVMLLQRNDFLVRAYADILKEVYSSQWDALYYILVDGTFHGVVAGRFKFGPHIIEDVVLDLTVDERSARREEIIEAIYEVFDSLESPIKRFDGKVQTDDL